MRQSDQPNKRNFADYVTRVSTPPIENIDKMPMHDVKQDTSLGTLQSVVKRGEDVPEDATEFIASHEGLARHIMEMRIRDWRRDKYRGLNRLNQSEEGTSSWIDPETGEAYDIESLSSLEGDAELHFPDPELTALEEDFSGELAAICKNGIDRVIDGKHIQVDPETVRRIVETLLEYQAERNQGYGTGKYVNGQNGNPSLRMRLHRLRKKTGLPLQVNFL